MSLSIIERHALIENNPLAGEGPDEEDEDLEMLFAEEGDEARRIVSIDMDHDRLLLLLGQQ